MQSAFAADEQTPAKSAPLDPARLSPDLLGLGKLIQAGVNEKVVLTYLKNAPPKRNPTAEELVYLHEIGLSTDGMVALLNAVPKVSLTDRVSSQVPGVAQPQTAQPSQPVASTPAQPAPAAAPVASPVISSPPPVVYTQPAPTTVYVESPPVVTYLPRYPTFSFGLDLGHHGFGHHFGGHHGGHGGGHHSGGHHGGHH